MFKKNILICILTASLSMVTALSAVAKDFDVKLVNSTEAVEYKINADIFEPATTENKIKFVNCEFTVGGIQILDYDGEIELILNELSFNESSKTVVNFAKVQNINFERQQA